MTERTHSEFQNLYDQHEKGIGSIPSTSHVPGCLSVPVSGLKNEKEFRKEMRKHRVRGLVNSLHEEGKKVGATWSAGNITLFIADKTHYIKDHKKEIAAGVVGVAVLGATIYLTRRSRQPK